MKRCTENDNRAKHAYLILAHHNFEQLAMLLETLDFPDNDIFIHIDKKSVFDPAMLTTSIRHSRIFFTDRLLGVGSTFSSITDRFSHHVLPRRKRSAIVSHTAYV